MFIIIIIIFIYAVVGTHYVVHLLAALIVLNWSLYFLTSLCISQLASGYGLLLQPLTPQCFLGYVCPSMSLVHCH